MTRPGAFGTGHVLALNQDTESVVFRGKGSIGLQLLANGDVQLAAGGVVRRNDESVLGRFDVALGNCADAFFCGWESPSRGPAVGVTSSAAETWPVASNSTADFRAGSLLADDLIELGCAHSGLLQLLEGAARFDALMLAGIADQQARGHRDPSRREELAHLVGAGEARFIDKVEVLLLS